MLTIAFMVKSVIFIDFYYKIENLNSKGLIHPFYTEIEGLFTYTHDNQSFNRINGQFEGPIETRMEQYFVTQEVIALICSTLLLVFLYSILTKIINRKSYSHDLLPFSSKWLNYVNLGVKRVIGIISNLILFAIIISLLIYPILLFTSKRLNFDTYTDTIQPIIWGSVGGICLYGAVWLVFYTISWLYFGFANKEVR